MQAVGKNCSICHEQIMIAKGSTVCLQCSIVFHDDCAASGCPVCKRPIDEVRTEYYGREATRLRRVRAWQFLFLAPIIALWALMVLLKDGPYAPYMAGAVWLAPTVICYLQARYLKMPSPFLWAVAGLFLNVVGMIYLLGYAHGRGLPQGEMGGKRK